MHPRGIPVHPRGIPVHPRGIPVHPCGIPVHPRGVTCPGVQGRSPCFDQSFALEPGPERHRPRSGLQPPAPASREKRFSDLLHDRRVVAALERDAHRLLFRRRVRVVLVQKADVAFLAQQQQREHGLLVLEVVRLRELRLDPLGRGLSLANGRRERVAAAERALRRIVHVFEHDEDAVGVVHHQSPCARREVAAVRGEVVHIGHTRRMRQDAELCHGAAVIVRRVFERKVHAMALRKVVADHEAADADGRRERVRGCGRRDVEAAVDAAALEDAAGAHPEPVRAPRLFVRARQHAGGHHVGRAVGDRPVPSDARLVNAEQRRMLSHHRRQLGAVHQSVAFDEIARGRGRPVRAQHRVVVRHVDDAGAREHAHEALVRREPVPDQAPRRRPARL